MLQLHRPLLVPTMVDYLTCYNTSLNSLLLHVLRLQGDSDPQSKAGCSQTGTNH